MRFWNHEVLENLDGVLEAIGRLLMTEGEEMPANPSFPSPPLRGEREGPIAEQWEGEVGGGERSGIPHLTPTLSAPGGGEGEPN